MKTFLTISNPWWKYRPLTIIHVSPEENLSAVFEELDEVISLDEISNV